jgi:hypothetical protein
VFTYWIVTICSPNIRLVLYLHIHFVKPVLPLRSYWAILQLSHRVSVSGITSFYIDDSSLTDNAKFSAVQCSHTQSKYAIWGITLSFCLFSYLAPVLAPIIWSPCKLSLRTLTIGGTWQFKGITSSAPEGLMTFVRGSRFTCSSSCQDIASFLTMWLLLSFQGWSG